MNDGQSPLRTLAAECWRILEAAPNERGSLLRTPVLATAGLDGAPECRTVVLRACDPPRRELTVFTDARSAKAAQVEADGRVSLTFYDPMRDIQLRIWGRASLHVDDMVSRDYWDAAPAASRIVYLSEPGPGQAVDEPSSGLPTDEVALETAYFNFAAIVITVRWLEWLRLKPDGNLSARFEWDSDDLLSASWIIP